MTTQEDLSQVFWISLRGIQAIYTRKKTNIR